MIPTSKDLDYNIYKNIQYPTSYLIHCVYMWASDLASHQSRSTAACSGVVLDAGVLQTGLTLLPESLHGLVTNLLLLLQLGLHLLSRTHRVLQQKKILIKRSLIYAYCYGFHCCSLVLRDPWTSVYFWDFVKITHKYLKDILLLFVLRFPLITTNKGEG